MDPTTVFYPNLACPATGHVGKDNISLHSHKEQRFIATCVPSIGALMMHNQQSPQRILIAPVGAIKYTFPAGLCREGGSYMDARQERGLQLVQRGYMVKQGDSWRVLSQTSTGLLGARRTPAADRRSAPLACPSRLPRGTLLAAQWHNIEDIVVTLYVDEICVNIVKVDFYARKGSASTSRAI